MAVPVPNNNASIGRLDDPGDSDYGSDFSAGEEQLVDRLLAEIAPGNGRATGTTTGPAAVTMATTSTTRNRNGISHNPLLDLAPASPSHSSTGVSDSPRLARRASPDDQAANRPCQEQHAVPQGPVQYPDLSHALFGLEAKTTSAPERSPLPTVEQDTDTRSPLQRFRTSPRRPLTVSDLAAGAWCELQHWYTLTLLPGGRKTKTPAMRGGSRVHQTLEDEVHSAVHVRIASKEEAFALRLWNIIQGLRTLRDTGLTREMEVWGKVDGEIINGVIDQLSHESPDPGFEAELSLASSNGSTQSSSITDYFGPSHKMVYLTDVKTRGSNRLPTGIALRPARVQLFLYHRLLSDMAADKLDYSDIFTRYGLRPEAHFSDAFIAQIGVLHDEIFYDADSQVEDMPAEVHSPELINYKSISQIMPLLRAELNETFPHGAASVGGLLAVQYRHREDGHIIGNNSFPNDPNALDAYVKESLQWWRGVRKPAGVEIEETYKCGWCEFAEACQWRRDKEAEFLREKRAGKAARAVPAS
ncbi:hypothetical protein F4861DRAFT_505392 [Xylaria intraflava]|nr:hypothetical protein F4861DRAFT_505392 [Xylaria intraflava]